MKQKYKTKWKALQQPTTNRGQNLENSKMKQYLKEKLKNN
jgi:hypothetical protein